MTQHSQGDVSRPSTREGREVVPLGMHSPRLTAAGKLTRASGRRQAGLFLAEGAQAVREGLAARAESEKAGQVGIPAMRELFCTEQVENRHSELIQHALDLGLPVFRVTERQAAKLSETVTPQGLIALCEIPETTVEAALGAQPRLVVVLAGVSDPGNAGTVIRVADAAGADAVILAGDSVDPWNGKAVRASTGSLFHLPVLRETDAQRVLGACRSAGLCTLAADGRAEYDLSELQAQDVLTRPTAWVFGSEAHGLPAEIADAVDSFVRVPLYGRAESLNLATAAAVCVYASAMAPVGQASARQE